MQELNCHFQKVMTLKSDLFPVIYLFRVSYFSNNIRSEYRTNHSYKNITSYMPKVAQFNHATVLTTYGKNSKEL